jgi:hypothetical protein
MIDESKATWKLYELLEILRAQWFDELLLASKINDDGSVTVPAAWAVEALRSVARRQVPRTDRPVNDRVEQYMMGRRVFEWLEPWQWVTSGDEEE